MIQAWPYAGARWWKFDFHTHTPASKDTNAWQAAIGTADELTPQRWLLKYMAAEIDCVAVTDHNSGEWVDGLKAAYSDMKRQADAGNPPEGFRELHLFPGVEISVQGGFHLLAVFDPSASSQTISDLLAKVHYSGTRGDSDGVTREGAAKVIEHVITEGGLAIPAHVEGDKGLLQVEQGTRKCLLDTNTVKQVLQEPGILALEWTSGSSSPPIVYEELKLRFASVVGSDCHSFKGSAVPGSRFTWIKMAKPNMEGLRLALLDGQEVSVRRSDQSDGFAPFTTPDHFIESIEIQNARYMGRGKTGASLPLNPYFNALIGGRGTGKSTIVHALRLAYRRENELSQASEAGQTFNKFNVVAKTKNDNGGLLDDTVVRVQVLRNGSPYRLTWRKEDTENMVEEWDILSTDFTPSDSQVINEQRFPVRLFSQGQIAALAGDSQQALLKVIDDAADTRSQRHAFEDAKSAFLASRARMREMEGKLSGLQSVTLALQDIKRKLERFEGSDHTVVLKNYQRTSQQNRELERQFDAAAKLVKGLENVAATLQPEDLQAGLFDANDDSPALASLQALNAVIGKVKQDVEASAAELALLGQTLKTDLESSPWFTRIATAREAYHQLKESLQQQGVNDPSEYGRLVQEAQRLDTELRNLNTLKSQHAELRNTAMLQLEQIQVARRAISHRRSEFLQATLHDNLYVRIELVPYSRDTQGIERSLREALGVGESKYADDLYQEQEGSTPKGLIADLMLAAELLGDTPSFEESLKTLRARLSQACRGKVEFGGWFNKFLKGETDRRPEYMDHLLCWFPEDGLQVEYSRKGNGRDFQSIGQASAGQRAAAMLAFLLAHGGEPLVLDQPEDDLDNHLIYGLVVQQIRSNKQRRQLIIVTHNPNIVVNGDAELIHVLDFNNQCHVKQTGSLQEQDMRQEVCQVMEGGSEAFERRYQRLGGEN
ncbi:MULTISPECIES: TrlF family AAA-like ATPase [Pseudomonas]|uniref:TrlF family AAA-like ATPase n=1 Tax=Pseudomonas TaxID=286 RepID=UPI001572F6D5|nr:MULTISPECIES: AAA family ATPase [Pseudomonas]MBG6125555.1 ABC-type Mn2+/Zn2+ transport system ATPase subunit [Pseudomonas sp. M2]NSX22492.1 chromosome segregation protein SMC [Pseudomonas putida]HDS1747607.1 chromosome segregation protein SMC [Pseudomonas putida]